jgi:fido (protein-threonine AMPylation protein)
VRIKAIVWQFAGSLRQRLLSFGSATIFQSGAREIAMAKGQMRSNKEKKKPKADKNIKKGGATPSPFSSGKTPAGQSPNSKK